MRIIDNYVSEFEKIISRFHEELATLKTGRANPAILDSIMVAVYETDTPLNQVASVNVDGARSIVIAPWDKNVLGDIEKAIRESDLDLNPANEGDKIRITLPLMTEESRQEIVKILHQKIEDARVAVRNLRDKIKEEIIKAEKDKDFGEDERFKLIEGLDKKSGEYNEKIREIGEGKEREIMTV